ncbi:hypothetical protein Pla110_45990 [Polystyrenella longa]|uniref:Uncharacterized protein n=1 Tax=Polystyrenella longa TaxID=2528007 RepID=A0A518CUD9_9PLAN|nr:Imm53 family immunity protein [Polystyrenella longa]QDU82836.1 hypothetical protein Pla110_45990 [Polystyrenella longa]
MTSVEDDLLALQAWYHYRCDGEWEHRYGLTIETCDNPGWQISFTDRPVSTRQQERIQQVLQQWPTGVLESDDTQTSLRLFDTDLSKVLQDARQVVDVWN